MGKVLGEKMKELRIQLGLKQADLLKKLDISSGRYSQYETGIRNPSYELLIKIADFYGVTTDYLLGHQSISQVILDEKILLAAYRQLDVKGKEDVKKYIRFSLFEQETGKETEPHHKEKVV